MMSSKGFLTPGPDRRPRMTAKHKAAIGTALNALFDYWVDRTDMPGMADATRAVLADALETYPTDRSCLTCDFLSGVTCLHWKEVIPAEAIEAGCDEHAEDAAPF